MSEPKIGMPVKLKKGMLQLSARQVQHITKVKKLPDSLAFSQFHNQDGGYWIKTDYTKGEWWAWSLFRIA